jgi:hypothetical protein
LVPDTDAAWSNRQRWGLSPDTLVDHASCTLAQPGLEQLGRTALVLSAAYQESSRNCLYPPPQWPACGCVDLGHAVGLPGDVQHPALPERRTIGQTSLLGLDPTKMSVQPFRVFDHQAIRLVRWHPARQHHHGLSLATDGQAGATGTV